MMTQPPPTGQNAPGTDFGGGNGSRSASTDTATPWSSTPPNASGVAAPDPWGTNAGRTGAYPGGEPNFTSTPVSAAPDAPTVTVPLVQGTRAPGGAGAPAEQGKRGNGAAPGTHSAPRSARTARARGPRRARLQLRHIDPWTVLKFACVLSIALFFVWLIVVGVLFGVLDGAGVINKINDTVTTINGGNAKPPITAGIVFGGAAIIGVVNIVLFIALSTIGSVVYNLCADLVGGIEVTLSER
jgi:hypothetical protein